MRTALLLLLLPALVGCEAVDQPTQSTALPALSVTRVSIVAQSGLVQLVYSVVNGDGRQFEFLRQNRAEPWKHWATAAPVAGMVTLDDTGVVPGQTYRYRFKVLGTPRDKFLDEVEVVVPTGDRN
jgi:hypothetical protein